MKVLIVDDSPTIRVALRGLVERMNHSVVEAENGSQALEIYRQDKPDVVLIDVVMPIMDGYDAAREMRKIRPDEWVPIIFLSSKEADQDLDRAIEAGGDDYLVKPVSFVVLNAKIRALQRLESTRVKLLETSRDLAAANRELESLSRQDSLTGIANRRYFDDYLQTEVKRASRDGQPLSLILADVDYFKAFNDRYGHQAGDDCLRRVANALKSVGRRPADLAARYGGEEFAMVLPATGAEGALDVAKALVRAVEQISILHGRSGIAGTVSLSQGIASVIPAHDTRPEGVIELADQALYEAKQQGRNRYVVSAGKRAGQ
ncbi:MAG TPA: diguanylate cyclase [Burkholderiales bacterium]|nr:diguanylate cyclase [Burkholderiales bacterium]